MGVDGLADGLTTPELPWEDRTVSVLCVDDDPATVELAAEFLGREDGIEVSTETDPQAALARLAEDPEAVDCVLSDYDMPGLTGLELLDELRDAGFDRPFVLFTGKGNEEIASRAVSAGVTDYIQKGGGSETFDLVVNRVEEAVAGYRAEQQVRRREQQFRELLRTAPAPITMYDADGTYLYANAPAAEFLGVDDPHELVGDSKYDYVSPAEHGTVDRRLSALAEGTPVPASEHVYVAADGTHKPGVASCSPAVPFDAAGVTVIREADRGVDAQRLGELAAAVSHDLRTPLETIEGRVRLARETGDLDHLAAVESAIGSIRTYTEDAVEVLRNEGFTPDPEPVELAGACRRAWAAVDTPEGTLSVNAAEGVSVEADPAGLGRLLENLFCNAVTHGGDDVTVTVDPAEDGFRVADDGAGAAADDDLFEPGYTTADCGSSMGLTSVKQVALAHGWTVAVEESDEGGLAVVVSGVAVR